MSGPFDFGLIKREFDEPMQRIYPDGEIFMGKGLGLDLQNATVSRFFPAYSRDFRRGLEILDNFYGSDRRNSRQLLSYVYTQSWAAYEALVLALLDALIDANLTASRSGRRFEEKQTRVFKALGLHEGFPPALALLYAQRNCLAHKSGIVDERLQELVKGIDDSARLLAQLKIGAPLPVDAESAVQFLDIVQHAARSLLRAAQLKL